ncbi:hypothetical protein FSP39_003436 [Pinctada imbricata]|uniref:Uncharacterized protein n=1 Tax=Pinctada imbricata TaxID=66713 RepID=A0AA88YPN8_PINIB|nr:hypothetical protein FSP39_003436 [Pinctada imbricata]
MATHGSIDLLSQSREILYGNENVEKQKEEITLESIFLLVNSMNTSLNDRMNMVMDKMNSLEITVKKINGMCDQITKLHARVSKNEAEISQLNLRCSDFDGNLQGLSNIFDGFKTKCDQTEERMKTLNNRLTCCETEMKRGIEENMTFLKKLREEKDELSEKVLDLKCRSMKNNLIFSGVQELPGENIEDVVREFIESDLGINEYIEIGNVHRFGRGARPGQRGRPRDIVVRFLYYQQLSLVLSHAKRLKGKRIWIKQQFPSEVEQARKSLYPVMNDMRSKGHRVKMVRDMLYVDGEVYEQPFPESPSEQRYALPRFVLETPNMNEMNTPERRPAKRYRPRTTPDSS